PWPATARSLRRRCCSVCGRRWIVCGPARSHSSRLRWRRRATTCSGRSLLLMKRRSALKLIAASAVLPSLEACARAFQSGTRWPATRYRIAPVHVAPERVIREVVGLRPFRRSGFRVEAEAIGEKTLVHNYGHGGGGMSLSWGSADLAAKLALATTHRRAAVIGCGALGLST